MTNEELSKRCEALGVLETDGYRAVIGWHAGRRVWVQNGGIEIGQCLYKPDAHAILMQRLRDRIREAAIPITREISVNTYQIETGWYAKVGVSGTARMDTELEALLALAETVCQKDKPVAYDGMKPGEIRPIEGPPPCPQCESLRKQLGFPPGALMAAWAGVPIPVDPAAEHEADCRLAWLIGLAVGSIVNSGSNAVGVADQFIGRYRARFGPQASDAKGGGAE